MDLYLRGQSLAQILGHDIARLQTGARQKAVPESIHLIGELREDTGSLLNRTPAASPE
jgi:hypothetical protein